MALRIALVALVLSLVVVPIEANTAKRKAKAKDPFAVVDAHGKAHHTPTHGSATDDKFVKEAEGLVDKISKDNGGKDSGDSIDKLLKELDDLAPDKDSKSVEAKADAEFEKKFGMDADKPLPELTTLKNDPRHKLDPLKDPNASAVEDMLGMTKEEREELAKEPRIDTPVDIAIKVCDSETRRLGCKDSQSPIHCLALAVRQQAAEISFECRSATEKSLQYACSVELFTTHCDGVEMPLIPCLDKNHPQLGEECKDALTVTKKVIKSIKQEKKKMKEAAHAGAKHAEPKKDIVRDQAGMDSSGSNMFIYMVIIAVVLAGLWTKGDGIAPVASAKRDIKRFFYFEARSAKIPEISTRHGGSSFDWTSSVDDEKEKSLNNFAALQSKTTSYGGL